MRRRKPDYPAHWKEFSRYIRFEVAQGLCQCTGECGLHKTHPGPRRCLERHGEPALFAKGIIVLTVAHLCSCTPLCANEAHCLGMCQKCHLRTDQILHISHAAETRRLNKELMGQLPLAFLLD